MSTRLDDKTENAIKSLVRKTGLKEAEILRRLIAIGLNNIKELADLIRI